MHGETQLSRENVGFLLAKALQRYETLDTSEFEKAEAALTCLSILIA